MRHLWNSQKVLLSWFFAVGLYLLGAALTLFLPEYFIDLELFMSQTHWDNVPPSFPIRLVLLWSAMTIPWAILVHRLRSSVRWPWIAFPIAVVCLAAAWVKPPHSPDIYHSVGHGRQLLIGVNPYAVTLLESPADSVLEAVKWVCRWWVHMPCLYGPLYLLFMCGVNSVYPDASLLTLGQLVKLFQLPAYALWGWVLWRHWKESPDRPLFMLLTMANPVTIFLFCIEGHVDIIMLAFTLASGLLLREQKPVLAALALCAATCIKMVPITIFPIFACWLWSHSRRKGTVFALTFLSTYIASHAFIKGGEWPAVVELSRSWNQLLWSGILPRLMVGLGITDLEIIGKAGDLCIYATVAILCCLHLSGKLKDTPFLSAALVLTMTCLVRTHVRPWYHYWFWTLLWMSSSNRNYLLLSTALCMWATIFSLWHSFMIFVPYINVVAIAIDLCFLLLFRYQANNEMQKQQAFFGFSSLR